MNSLTTVALLFAVTVALVGGLLFWLPRLTRPDLYFAVTVAPGFRDSGEGRGILGRYRTLILLCAAAALGLVAAGTRWPATLVAAILIQYAGSFVAYLSCRRRVMPRAVEPVAVREAPLRARSARLPGGWALEAGPLLLLAGAALDLNRRWAEIPARFPIHWALDGRPDGWASRTPANVYGLPAEGVLMCLMMAGLAYGLVRWSRPVRFGGAPGEAESHFRRVVVLVLIATEYLMGITFAGLSQLPLRSGPPPMAAMLALPLLFAAIVVVALVREGQGGSRRASASEQGQEGRRPVGDRTLDRYWKAGFLYVNPDDPALFIEKRFGIGYTLNFGRPGSWVIIGAIVLVPVIIGLIKVATK
jgi:uncharacterized membrane protein